MLRRPDGERRRALSAWDLLRLWPALLLTLLALPSAGAAQGAGSAFHGVPPTLGAGDVIHIQVWRQPEFSGEFEISGAGTIAHPLYRSIRAAGRLVTEVEEDVRAFLAEYVESPNFVVEGYFRVGIAGEVRQPDVYPLRPETTITRALAVAGGPSERANLRRVMIRRNGQLYRLDLTSSESSLRELQVRSGDEIVVERRRDVFRDYLAPSASVIAAAATLVSLLLR